MIPEFPTFKKLELSDKKEIESFTSKFPPHSDFSFNSLWSWDTTEKRMVSKLNGNLVVRFTDYLTEESFLSFLGTNQAYNTVRELSSFGIANGLSPSVRMLSEQTIAQLSVDEVHIIDDVDNFDYVLEASLESFPKRRDVKRFLRDYPDAYTSVLNLSQRDTVLEVKTLLKKTTSAESPQGEVESTERFLGAPDILDHFALGVFAQGQLVAYYVGEYALHPYTIGLFWRADRTVSSGVYSYLMWEVMTFIRRKGYSLINIEQDMGVTGLRRWKESLRPKMFLKKYIVTPMQTTGIKSDMHISTSGTTSSHV